MVGFARHALGGNAGFPRHIALWGTSYGPLGITSNRLNHVSGGNHVFAERRRRHDSNQAGSAGATMAAATDIALGRAPTQPFHAVWKQYVDPWCLSSPPSPRCAPPRRPRRPRAVRSYAGATTWAAACSVLYRPTSTVSDNGGTVVDAFDGVGIAKAARAPHARSRFGAIGDGATYDTAAIQSRDQRGRRGGRGHRQIRCHYRITGTLQIGNGTSGADSTASVRLEGVGGRGFRRNSGGLPRQQRRPILTWRVVPRWNDRPDQRPAPGLGRREHVLDGTPLAVVSVPAQNGSGISAQNGYSPGLTIRVEMFGLYSTTVPLFGADAATDSFRNHYPTGLVGVAQNGALGSCDRRTQSNTDYNVFENLVGVFANFACRRADRLRCSFASV